jgi:uncharacterized protein YaeQ
MRPGGCGCYLYFLLLAHCAAAARLAVRLLAYEAGAATGHSFDYSFGLADGDEEGAWKEGYMLIAGGIGWEEEVRRRC